MKTSLFTLSSSWHKKSVLHFSWIATIALLIIYLGWQSVSDELSLEQKIAQKLMIDVRYYCEPSRSEGAAEPCKSAVTRLPDDLHALIKETSLGGVILFAENLQTTEQMIDLTQQLQDAALQSAAASPLFISIDQEGGRVFRTPRTISTGFAGNMAIGATYARHGVHYAAEVGAVLARELSALGINTNHAPVMDVNSNPDNPVINVRSFGEQPQMVADLSVAMLQQMQQAGVMATLKHFPGHGDTHLDSHLALPLVDHPRHLIEQVDLAPFQWAIDQSNPAMIMTAHIQYPALDDSQVITRDGEAIVRPATMSRAILTDLLRDQMHFEGVVITDALDMAAISHYFDPLEAVIETFAAGADIALMPYPIRTADDISAFKRLIADIATAVRQGRISLDELEQSVARIAELKQSYLAGIKVVADRSGLYQHASSVLAQPSHRQLEQSLATEAVTLVQDQAGLLPLQTSDIKHVHLIAATELQAAMLKQEFDQQWPALRQGKVRWTQSVFSNWQQAEAEQLSQQADWVIHAGWQRLASLVDAGGMADQATQQPPAMTYQAAMQASKQVLGAAKAEQRQVLLLGFGTPYELEPLLALSDVALLAYHHGIHREAEREVLAGPTYRAVVTA
ncbi:MAG: glycoside hydrolase family 3 protein, partial [Alkalimonas sp.]|nr:glycoside hydrolase family 3 protein [Alkalimonas sp.]